MSQHFYDILDKGGDCTVQEIRSLLESQPELQNYLPLIYVVIRQKFNVNVVRELLKNVSNINRTFYRGDEQYTLLQDACAISLDDCDTNHYKIITLLLNSGANINIGGISSPLHRVIRIVNLKSEFFIPMVQLMLQYTDESTKTDAIKHLFSTALAYAFYYRPGKRRLKNCIQAVKLFLESGTPHEFGIFKYLFEKTLKYCSRTTCDLHLNFQMSLYRVILPFIFVKNFCENENLMTYDIKSHFEDIIEGKRKESSNNDIQINFEVLYDRVIHLWDNCFHQSYRMSRDILKNNCNLLQTLKDLCYTEYERKVVLPDAVYEVMLKLATNDYYCFTDAMKQAVKNSDMPELYRVIAMGHCESKYILHPDCYPITAQYLSKEDQLNYFLALLPERKKSTK